MARREFRARLRAAVFAALLTGALAPGSACRKTDSPPGPGGSQSAATVASGESRSTGDSASAAGATSDGAGAPEAAPPPTPPPRTGCASEAAKRIPQSPDPADGAFSLEEAVAGLAGEAGGLTATIETSVAALRCTLETAEVPATVANFVGLARGLRPWWDPCRGEWVREPMYDGMKFHRLEAGFVAQTGCPIGDGTGGPGYAIPDELGPRQRHDRPGVLSMANVGAGTAGSQFFVALAAAPELDRRFARFGRCGPEGEVVKLDQAAKEGREVRVIRVTMERATSAGGGE
jgi:peptidyl-prolyl cis-trans isomerase A (cyclophilin A)